MYRTILVDDERLALQRLRKLLVPFSDRIEVIGEAMEGKEAVAMIDSLKPDLVFLDIQMPGLTGFEVIASIQHQPIIVFATAYDRYALEAFEVNSVDYLLKPIESDRLKKTIEKLDQLAKPFSQDLLKHLETMIPTFQRKGTRWIHVKTGDKIQLINPESVYYFSADEKYVRVHTFDREYLISRTLGELEKDLGEDFVRIHRSSLVNIAFIDEIFKMFKGSYKVRMKDQNKTELAISRYAKHKLGLV